MELDGIDVVLFDYGGVLAEEGFTAGLKAIAKANGIDPEEFFHNATEVMYECGYVTGIGTSEDFWNGIRKTHSLHGDNDSLTLEIHSRFILRTGMMDMIRRLKNNGIRTAILSDQTDWLYILNDRDRFLHEFSPVLNSFRLGLTKRDPEVFNTAKDKLQVPADRILFVDDNKGHISRAKEKGFQTHLFLNEAIFRKDLESRNLLNKTEV